MQPSYPSYRGSFGRHHLELWVVTMFMRVDCPARVQHTSMSRLDLLTVTVPELGFTTRITVPSRVCVQEALAGSVKIEIL